MLFSSFIFLDKIGKEKEIKLWEKGIRSWAEFLKRGEIKGISKTAKQYYNRRLREARNMALGYNSCWFNFPSNEEWRLYDYFKDDAAYIDIETGSRKEVSVVGIYFRDKVFQFVSGINMDKGMIKKIIDESSMIVSFNGKSFDLPVLKRYFGDIFKKPHLDLMHAGRKVGLRGGLKLIEKEIGVKRDEEVCGMDGEGAVFLWDMYKNSGNREYLKKLLLYNEEDIVNLKPLAEHVYKELHESIKNKFFK